MDNDKQVRMNLLIGTGWLVVLVIVLSWDALNGREMSIGPSQATVAACVAFLAISFLATAHVLRWSR